SGRLLTLLGAALAGLADQKVFQLLPALERRHQPLRTRAASGPGLAGLRVRVFRRDLAALERRGASATPAGRDAETAQLRFKLLTLVSAPPPHPYATPAT